MNIYDGESAEEGAKSEAAAGDAAAEGTQSDEGKENTDAESQEGKVDTSSLMDAADEGQEAEGDEGGKKPAEGDEGKDADEEGKEDKSEGAPEEYADFTFEEGTTLDPELLDEFKEQFKADNLTQEEAQKRVDQGVRLAAKWQQNSLKNMQTTINGWKDETRKDPEIGGDKLAVSLAAAKQARDTFGTEGFTKVLDTFGLGNHPEVIRFLAKVRAEISDDVFVKDGKPTGKPKSAAETLFGKTHSK